MNIRTLLKAFTTRGLQYKHNNDKYENIRQTYVRSVTTQTGDIPWFFDVTNERCFTEAGEEARKLHFCRKYNLPNAKGIRLTTKRELRQMSDYEELRMMSDYEDIEELTTSDSSEEEKVESNESTA